jgi:hypothetical protein
MLNITDLTASKELESKDMAGVRGGTSPFLSIDFSHNLTNKVAETHQGFGFAFAQANHGAVTNNQGFAGGNGYTSAPVDQYQYQDNDMYVYDIGNVSVS